MCQSVQECHVFFSAVNRSAAVSSSDCAASDHLSLFYLRAGSLPSAFLALPMPRSQLWGALSCLAFALYIIYIYIYIYIYTHTYTSLSLFFFFLSLSMHIYIYIYNMIIRIVLFRTDSICLKNSQNISRPLVRSKTSTACADAAFSTSGLHNIYDITR